MDSTSESAKQVFSQYGAVKETTVLPVLAGKTAAAAFVIMETLEDAKWIVDNVNGNVPQGLMSQVTVVFATPREQRKGGGKGKKGMDGMWGMMSMMGGGGGWGGGWGKGGGGGDWGGAWGKEGGGGWGGGCAGWGKGGGPTWGGGGSDWGSNGAVAYNAGGKGKGW